MHPDIRLRWGLYWLDRYKNRNTGRMWWEYIEPSKREIIRIDWGDRIDIAMSDLCWPLEGTSDRLDHYDMSYLMVRLQWKSITKEHFRMIVRRVLEREIHDS